MPRYTDADDCINNAIHEQDPAHHPPTQIPRNSNPSTTAASHKPARRPAPGKKTAA